MLDDARFHFAGDFTQQSVWRNSWKMLTGEDRASAERSCPRIPGAGYPAFEGLSLAGADGAS